MKRVLSLFILGLISLNLMAQYPPPAGVEGTSAIHKDSSIFVAWANECQVERGYINIDTPDSGYVNYGETMNAIGAPNSFIISLGDGGEAILQFEKPIKNGPGPDFAIFENSFSDDFLELALVYVSSDGLNYDVFPAVSLSQTETQIEGFGKIDATKIHNLAGKYRQDFGTPFDISEIESALNKKLDPITHIKIVDVIGSINPLYASYDSQNNIINDPWPTPFPTSGFDLNAVGVIHQVTSTQELDYTKQQVLVYPNPNNGDFYINNKLEYKIKNLSIYSIQGQLVYETNEMNNNSRINTQLPSGTYIIDLQYDETTYQSSFIIY